MSEQAKPFKMLMLVVLIFRATVWYSIATSKTATTVPGNKERPAEQCKKLDGCLHPIECRRYPHPCFHHGKKVGNGVVDGFVKTTGHGVPDGVGYLLPKRVEHAADGIADA